MNKQHQIYIYFSFLITISMAGFIFYLSYQTSHTSAPKSSFAQSLASGAEKTALEANNQLDQIGRLNNILPFTSNDFIIESFDPINSSYQVKLNPKNKKEVLYDWLDSNGYQEIDKEKFIFE